MVTIPSIQDPTLQALDEMLVAKSREEKPRDYLGASSIGEACSRKLWYRLYSGIREEFDADTLRKFLDGHRTEQLIIDWLRRLPFIELHTSKPDGKQYGFEDGKYRGNYDGIILGILQAPKTWHIFEAKCVNEKKFNELNKLKAINKKTALKNWDKVYHAQAIAYMAAEGLTRHYLICATPGGRQLTSVRTDANPELAAQLSDKAHKIIEAKEPPTRISDKPDYYECSWCFYKGICHGQGT